MEIAKLFNDKEIKCGAPYWFNIGITKV